MYQDLSFMNVPLPEDILKLKIYQLQQAVLQLIMELD